MTTTAAKSTKVHYECGKIIHAVRRQWKACGKDATPTEVAEWVIGRFGHKGTLAAKFLESAKAIEASE